MLEGFLEALDQQGDPAADGFRHILELVADDRNGPRALPMSLSHEICKEESLWQFIKGRWRIPWFYGGDCQGRKKIIVCAEGFFKKGQKTPPPIIESTTAIKNKFNKARLAGRLIIHDD